MNYINFFINPDVISAPDKIAIKKQLFGVDSALETCKFLFGFFLDGDAASPSEEESIEKLQRYEFFAPSLSCQRLINELQAFFQTAEFIQLQPDTQEQLKQAVCLLKESQDINGIIDDIRSSEIKKIFLVLTGQCPVSIEGQEVKPEILQKIIDKARPQVALLPVGGQAVFLAGNITHETLLSIVKIDDEHFELCYYNTADSMQIKRKYQASRCLLLEEGFWESLYSSKFKERETALVMQLNALDPIEHTKRDFCASLVQRKNTCHLRCFLAFIKDRIIQKSLLSIEDSYVDWHLFKELFGGFLLKNGNLSQKELERLCQEKQEGRALKRIRAADFQSCVKQGEEEETFTIYRKLMHQLTQEEIHLEKNKSSVYNLIRIEKKVLEAMEGYCISPIHVGSLFVGISNPWVLQTFKRFAKRFPQRQTNFQNALEEELNEISSAYYLPLKTLKYSVLNSLKGAVDTVSAFASRVNISVPPIDDWEEDFKTVMAAPIESAEVQKLLERFENCSEELAFLDQKPCCRAIVRQAIQLGMIDQVNGIYQKLSPTDQETLLNICKERGAFFYPAFPKTLSDFIVASPESDLAKNLFIPLCLQSLHHGKLSEFLRLTHKMLVLDPYSIIELSLLLNGLKIPDLEIPQEEMINALSLLDALDMDRIVIHCSDVKKLLFLYLGQSLLKQEKISPDVTEHLNRTIKWRDYRNFIQLCRLYRDGCFKQVETLLDKVKFSSCLPDIHFCFSKENYHKGLELLKGCYPLPFLSIVFCDLVRFSCQYRSQEILMEALKNYSENSVVKKDKYSVFVWPVLDYSAHLFIVQAIAANHPSEWLQVDKIYEIADRLIQECDSKEKFDEMHPVVDALYSKFPLVRFYLNHHKLYYQLAEYLDPSSDGFLAKLLRGQACAAAFRKLIMQDHLHRNGIINDYRKNINVFIKNWQWLANDVISQKVLENLENLNKSLSRDIQKNPNLPEIFEKMPNHNDLTSLQEVYSQLVRPIFKDEISMSNSKGDGDVILELFKRGILADPLRLAFALLYKEKGDEEMALKIFQDKTTLDVASSVIT